MWLRLNVLNDGSCAYIYASDADDVKYFFIPKSSWRVVRIWHNDASPSLLLSYADDSPIRICDNMVNDHYIDFKSEVSFDCFCEKFEQSEYNDPTAYNILRHNCSNAALFALHLAGIPIPAPKLIFGRVHGHATLHLPMVLTPETLYKWAVNYKEQKQCTPSSEARLQQHIRSTACFFKKHQTFHPRIKEATDELTSQAEQTLTQYPHHADSVFIALEQAVKLLASNTLDKHVKKLEKLSEFFFFRERSLVDQWFSRRLDYVNTVIVVTIIECLTVFIDPWLFSSLLILLVLLQLCECLSTIPEPEFFSSPKSSTPFSEALQELVSLMNESKEVGNAPSTLVCGRS